MDQPPKPQPRVRPPREAQTAETRRLSPAELFGVVGEAGGTPSAAERYPLMVVEDDPTIAFTLEYMLTREGFEVHAAPDGRAAKEMIERIEPPRVVLLDLLLPHYDGFQLIELIRSSPDWAETPIIMLTSNSQERDIVRALNAGANDYITKPFQLMELVARLRRFCRLPG